MRDIFSKLNDKSCISKWHGYSPFYAGCFYGNKCCLGGEAKYSHCYDFYSGVGDIEYWIQEELDKLSEEQQSELLEILKRNKNVDDFINSNHESIKMITNQLNLEGTHIIYRLGNKNILKLLKSQDVINEYSNILNEINFDPVTLRNKI
jgi:uncharacterized protein YdhG (YjbR/CyaY superfamily)